MTQVHNTARIIAVYGLNVGTTRLTSRYANHKVQGRITMSANTPGTGCSDINTARYTLYSA